MKSSTPAGMSLSKRRFLVMAGSVGALAAFSLGSGRQAQAAKPVLWKGSALGAEASIQLFHDDPNWAQQQLLACQREIDRLENLFSLYRPQSAVCRLNAEGKLENPDVDFLALMSQALSFSKQTDGVFDITVQPLWRLYAEHFSKPGADPQGPTRAHIEETLSLVGSSQIELTSREVAFRKPGMAVTLNGIAQGYITDRITVLLKKAGFENVLVSLGENYALGSHPDGSPWRAGISSPEDGKAVLRTVDLIDKALATSGGYGSPFTSTSSLNHLINPVTGKTAAFNKSVSVIARSAVKADMASTALSLMEKSAGEALITSQQDIQEVIYL